MKTVDLRCEGIVNPLGIDALQPRLSWKLVANDATVRKQTQGAYQVLVAGSQEAIDLDRGDLWDSGRVESDQSIQVPYAGKPLVSREACFWKVRTWDQDHRPSAWSSPGTWSVGLLHPADWQAKWIGPNASDANWKDYTLKVHFVLEKESAGFYFHVQDVENAYFWQVSNTGTEPVLKAQSKANGAFRVLKEVPISKAIGKNDFARPHDLRVVVHGGQIDTWLDEIQVDTLKDDTHPQGGVGFRSSRSERQRILAVQVTDSQGKTLLNRDFAQGSENPFTMGEIKQGGLETVDVDSILDVGPGRSPLLRREFDVSKPIRRARLYATALGLYEMHLNAARVGTDCLTPGWTDYHRRAQYQTYDVSGLLRPGRNALAAMLAPGWYAGNLAWFGPSHYGQMPRLLTRLEIEYADGTTQAVASDESWKMSGAGPVISADLLDGENYDARREMSGWDLPGFNDASWEPAIAAAAGAVPAQVVAQADPPVKVLQELVPRKVTETRSGVYIFDLGQNITGVARIKVKGPAGTRLTLRFGETLLPNGSLYTTNLNKAKATDVYTLKGQGDEVWQPQFTFHGFRYVELTGYPGQPGTDAITGLLTATAVPQTGQIETSNPLINNILSNIFWSGRDAFLSIPMDSPQRSERLGWTGDACFFVATATDYFDMSRFYAKWETDITNEQMPNGLYPNVAPNFRGPGGYGGGWGDAGIVVPYVIWQRYGDLQIVRDHFDSMSRWIEFLRSKSKELILPLGWAPAGDWLNVDDETPHDLVATAYFAYDVQLMETLARALGREADAHKYAALFHDIQQAFAKQYVAADGTVSSGSQTAQVLALHIGLLTDNLRQPALDRLLANIEKRGMHLSTGFVGTQWLWSVLADSGHLDVAYALLEQTTMPSYGYEVGKAATTVWESWNAVKPDGTVMDKRNSLNHSALGSAGDWMFQTLGGVVPDPAAPGFKHVFIHPRPGGSIQWTKTHCDTTYGALDTSWRQEGRDFQLAVTVPVNTTASISIPSADVASVREGSGSATAALGVRLERKENGLATFAVGSGTYTFRSVIK